MNMNSKVTAGDVVFVGFWEESQDDYFPTLGVVMSDERYTPSVGESYVKVMLPNEMKGTWCPEEEIIKVNVDLAFWILDGYRAEDMPLSDIECMSRAFRISLYQNANSEGINASVSRAKDQLTSRTS